MATEKTYPITAPNRDYEGTAEGVAFTKGKGRGTLRQAARLAVRGYGVPDAVLDQIEDATGKARGPRPTAAVLGVDRDAVERSIDELSRVPGIGPATADKVRDAGYPTLPALAAADVGDLATALGTSEDTAKGWVQAAAELAAPAGSATDPLAPKENAPE